MSNPPQLLAPDRATAREIVFRRLMDQRIDASYRFALALLGEADDAEDVVHDAVIRAWRAFGSLRDPSSVDAWFSQILLNTCRDHLRGRRARPTVRLDPTGSWASTGPDPGHGDAERDALRWALARLSPDHQTVLVLRFYLDLPVEQIAQRLGKRPGTVKSRLHNAMRSLRAAYDAGLRPTREHLG
jgi:RNA polymerase sigma-70 factor, ECF subfamily